MAEIVAMTELRTVELRFFAAARSAARRSETSVTGEPPLTIAGALALVVETESDYADIVSRCSFLVNAVATTDRDFPLTNGDVVDVLPPFAGG